MRQHVNPLSRYFQLSRELPGLNEIFYDANLPLHLDIGSARGKFLLSMAELHQEWNFLGVEIRNKLVESAKNQKDSLCLSNLEFLFCNANISLECWLKSLPNGILRRVSIQFPDPWFKRRHWKRRVMQPSLLHCIAEAMPLDGQIFIQSDLFEVIKPMASLVELSKCFSSCNTNDCLWDEANPFEIPTERELYVLKKGDPIFRALYRRNKAPVPRLDDFEEMWLEMNT